MKAVSHLVFTAAFLFLTLPLVHAGGKKDVPLSQEEKTALTEEENMDNAQDNSDKEEKVYRIPDPEKIQKPSIGEGGGKGVLLVIPPLDDAETYSD